MEGFIYDGLSLPHNTDDHNHGRVLINSWGYKDSVMKAGLASLAVAAKLVQA